MAHLARSIMAHRGAAYPIEQRFRYINLFTYQNRGNGWIAKSYQCEILNWLAGSIPGLATGIVETTNEPWAPGDRDVYATADFSGTSGHVVLVSFKLSLDTTGTILNGTLQCTVDGNEQVDCQDTDFTGQGADSAIFNYGGDYTDLPGYQAVPLRGEWNATPWPP